MEKIQTGDIVSVNFHGAQFTLTQKAKVIWAPESTNDAWIFKDIETGVLYYVSEGCTVTLIDKKEL